MRNINLNLTCVGCGCSESGATHGILMEYETTFRQFIIFGKKIKYRYFICIDCDFKYF